MSIATALGLRLPTAALPTVSWLPWSVVPRAHGFHVSREAAGGASTEFLRNEVRQVKVFRSELAALKACQKANFDATATALSREPLMGGRAQHAQSGSVLLVLAIGCGLLAIAIALAYGVSP